MIETLTFKNTLNQIIDLHTDQIAVYKFDDPVTQRPGDPRPRMEDHGEWATKTRRGSMTIDIEGDLLAESAADYFTLRQSIVNVLFPNPDLEVTLRRDGFLRVKFTGATEEWHTEVSVRAFTAPRSVDNGGPSRTSFMLTFYSFTPYYIGSNTGAKYYDS